MLESHAQYVRLDMSGNCHAVLPLPVITIHLLSALLRYCLVIQGWHKENFISSVNHRMQQVEYISSELCNLAV
jgi:hypothetical protein